MDISRITKVILKNCQKIGKRTHLTVKNGTFKKFQKSLLSYDIRSSQPKYHIPRWKTEQTDTHKSEYRGYIFRVSGILPSTYYQGSVHYLISLYWSLYLFSYMFLILHWYTQKSKRLKNMQDRMLQDLSVYKTKFQVSFWIDTYFTLIYNHMREKKYEFVWHEANNENIMIILNFETSSQNIVSLPCIISY